jgi:hypothetical protein
MLRDLKPLAPSLTETRSGELKKQRPEAAVSQPARYIGWHEGKRIVLKPPLQLYVRGLRPQDLYAVNGYLYGVCREEGIARAPGWRRVVYDMFSMETTSAQRRASGPSDLLEIGYSGMQRLTGAQTSA